MSVVARALRATARGSTLKRVAYPVADRLLGAWGAWRSRSYDIENSVALVSTGRGGSTWLAELVMSLPNRVMIWEPLHLGNNPAVARLGVGWNTYLPHDAEAPELETYLRRLLTGRELSTQTLTSLSFDLKALLRPEGFVVKFVQVHPMLPWFERRFPTVPIVGLVRHPCAVVASQLKHGPTWRTLTKDTLDVDPAMLADFPHIAQVFERIETTSEALAFEWGVRTFFLLRAERPLVVAYEALVADPPAEAERIFAYLGEALPPSAVAQARRPSATTNESTEYEGWRDRLTSWQRTVSADDQERIIAMAHDLGVTCYGPDPWPELPGVAPSALS